MNLNEFIKTEEIEKELTYTRAGQLVKAFPKTDCSVNEKIDEIIQLKEISGKYYFYGQILGEITEALNTQKSNLKTKIGFYYLKRHKELQNSSSRITDKMLEHLINVESEIIYIKNIIAKLEGAEKKLEIILTALKLKEESLIEASRRKSQELKTINNLT